MKRFLALLLIIAAVVFPVAMFAQVDSTAVAQSGQSLGDILNGSGSLLDFFVSLAALVPLVTALSAYLNSKIYSTGWQKQAVSWIVSLVLCFGAWFVKVGLFVGISWWVVLIYGFVVGLAANGFFDIKIIQTVLGAVGLGKKK